jgi:hypothetical protein
LVMHNPKTKGKETEKKREINEEENKQLQIA